MRISEVAEITGLTASNIRFYEKKGLLSPRRKEESKYRDYSQDDIERLRKIILYRKMNISLETVYLLFEGNAALEDVLRRQEQDLIGQMEMLQGSIELCRKLQQEQDLKNIDIDYYLYYVKEEEEKGKCFAQVEDFLEDLAGFSRTIMFRGDPYVGKLFENVWVARGIALLWLGAFLIVPVLDIIIRIRRGEPVTWNSVAAWVMIFLCIGTGFMIYRKTMSDKNEH